MKKAFVKIGLIIAILCVALVSLALTEKLLAASAVDTKTFILPVDKDSRASATAITIVVFDADTGNVVNGTTGVSASNTTWDSGEITGAQHSVSNEWKFTIPKPVDSNGRVLDVYMKVYHVAAASVSKATIPSEQPFLYLWETNRPYGDDSPTGNGRVITVQR
jgi:hypothetical protein